MADTIGERDDDRVIDGAGPPEPAPASDGERVLPIEVHTLSELGAQLERMRVLSGLTLRQLAQEISDSSAEPIGPSALGSWCRGERLPQPSRYPAFKRLLDLLGVANTEPWIHAVTRIRASGRRSVTEVSPYMGLRSFSRDDADRFFGRSDLVDRAYTRFRQVLGDVGRPRVVWVVGASGAGKSSLLQAGLRPVLEAAGHPCVSLTPGPHPADRLAGALAEALVIDPADVPQRHEDDPGEWVAFFQAAVERGPTGLVLIVDQFEELFRACRSEPERQAFLALLGALTDRTTDGDAALVGGLRIDFYKDVAAHELFVGPLEDGQILVGPLNRAELTDCIVQPALQESVAVEPSLVAALLREFIPTGSIAKVHDPGALPLLAHALNETWRRRAHQDRMTVDDYNAVGGIHEAIEDSAERVYEQLSDDQKAVARELFLRLVHLEGAGAATRRVVGLTELAGFAADGDGEGGGDGDGDAARATSIDVVDRFVEERLLTVQESTVEIVHEALLGAWPRLSSWIEQDREALLLQRRVTDATREWLELDRDDEALAGGIRLEAMRALREDDAPRLRLNQDEIDYVDASIARAEKRERARRRQNRRLRVLAGVAVVGAVAAASLAVLVNGARRDATQARDDARSRQTALNAEQLSETDPGLAAQLAVAGYTISPTVEARSAVLATRALPTSTRALGGSGPTALATVPDGSLTAISNAVDGTVQLYTREEGTLGEAGLVDPGTPETAVYALAFTPNGRFLFTGNAVGEIILWDVADTAHPRQVGESFQGPSDKVERLVVSPDGSELAAAGPGTGVHRWDITDPTQRRPLALLPSPSATWSVAYDASSRQAVVSNDTGEVDIWELADEPRQVATLSTTEQPLFSVALSADGDLLAAGGQDGRLYVWDVSAPSRPQRVRIEQGRLQSWVNTVAFGGDRYLLAGGSDLDLKVWDRSSWTVVATFRHPAALTNAVFLDEGRTILSVAHDGTGRWWDVGSALSTHAEGRVWGLSYDATGDRFAMVSGDEALVWSGTAPLGGRPPLVQVRDLAGAEDKLSGTGVLSPDGIRLALGSRTTGDVYLVDLAGPGSPDLLVPPLGGGHDLVENVAFSPDGKVLAAGGDDMLLRLWTLDEAGEATPAAVIDDIGDKVLYLAWSPDGRYLAAPSTGTVHLFDAADPEHPRRVARLEDFGEDAFAATFTPDGSVLATSGPEGSVILWDVTDPASPGRIGEPLRGPQARILDLAVDTSGTYLAAGVADGTTWLWDVSDMSAIARLAVLGPADASINQVEFDPATGLLAASGADGRLFLWEPDVDEIVANICASAGDPITRKEWNTYLPDTPYSPPCQGQ